MYLIRDYIYIGAVLLNLVSNTWIRWAVQLQSCLLWSSSSKEMKIDDGWTIVLQEQGLRNWFRCHRWLHWTNEEGKKRSNGRMGLSNCFYVWRFDNARFYRVSSHGGSGNGGNAGWQEKVSTILPFAASLRNLVSPWTRRHLILCTWIESTLMSKKRRQRGEKKNPSVDTVPADSLLCFKTHSKPVRVSGDVKNENEGRGLTWWQCCALSWISNWNQRIKKCDELRHSLVNPRPSLELPHGRRFEITGCGSSMVNPKQTVIR